MCASSTTIATCAHSPVRTSSGITASLVAAAAPTEPAEGARHATRKWPASVSSIAIQLLIDAAAAWPRLDAHEYEPSRAPCMGAIAPARAPPTGKDARIQKSTETTAVSLPADAEGSGRTHSIR